MTAPTPAGDAGITENAMPTLDDLAAQLAALGFEERSPAPDHFRKWYRGELIVWSNLEIGGRIALTNGGCALSAVPDVWDALDAIRQWQSGARPEPVGAETVTITDAMIERGAEALYNFPQRQQPDFSQTVDSERTWFRRRSRMALEAALAGEPK